MEGVSRTQRTQRQRESIGYEMNADVGEHMMVPVGLIQLEILSSSFPNSVLWFGKRFEKPFPRSPGQPTL